MRRSSAEQRLFYPSAFLPGDDDDLHVRARAVERDWSLLYANTKQKSRDGEIYASLVVGRLTLAEQKE